VATTMDISTDAKNENRTSSFWSIADECAHYAALGCHIASIARYFVPPKNNKNNSGNNKVKSANNSNTTPYISALHASCLECKEDMYKCAMQHHPWLLGIEHFDPSEYNPSDLLNFPEVAMNDGVFDDDDAGGEDDCYDDGDQTMTLTLTNITQDTIKVYIVSVYDVDLCDAAGNVLKSGKASKTTVDSAAGGVEYGADDGDGSDYAQFGGGRLLKTNPLFSTASSSAARTTTTRERKCTTFIVLCPPRTYVHLCSLAPNQQLMASSTSDEKVPITSWSQIEIETDIQPWSYHPNTDDEHPYLMHFPFAPGTGLPDITPAFQCTQSENGQLTHFFHGNYHAVDFTCPIGTPLYSPVNGRVVEVRDGGNNSFPGDLDVVEVSGIAARNMFYWNSVMVQAVDDNVADVQVSKNKEMVVQSQEPKKEDPLYIEFVHIQSNSCVVEVGDVVTKGQLLCWSGSVGFCPEPHLHFAAYRGDGKDAATVRVRFECGDLTAKEVAQDGIDKVPSAAIAGEGRGDVASYLPRAGGWYNSSGLLLE
jgi:murein DD-endopeptidase MepM/ murein hydrolase activator NlpD